MARKMAKETVWRIVIEKERLAVKMVLVNMFSLVKMFSLVSTILQSTYTVNMRNYLGGDVWSLGRERLGVHLHA